MKLFFLCFFISTSDSTKDSMYCLVNESYLTTTLLTAAMEEMQNYVTLRLRFISSVCMCVFVTICINYAL
jgi:hypothetical protein